MSTNLHIDHIGNLILRDGKLGLSVSSQYVTPPHYGGGRVGALSLYAYCAGDPVNLIDPTGESTYNITTSWKDGQQSVSINCIETDDDFDMIYVDGEKNGVKLADQSIMKRLMTNREQQLYSSNVSMYTSSKNGEDMGKLFFYLADNSNVEWSASKYSDGTYALGAYAKYSTTNRNVKGAAPGRFDKVQSVDKEEAHIHSHISGTMPSDADYQMITVNRNAIRDLPGNDRIPTYSETSTQYLYLKNTNVISKFYYFDKNNFHENRGLISNIEKKSFELKR